ncbi:MAG: PKD domain-containing protein [Planctomycetota bacterium]|nr:PKD domain-containing protein [Planctomycetota bacterium]
MKEEILDLYRRLQSRYRWVRGVDLLLELSFFLSIPIGALLLFTRLFYEWNWIETELSTWAVSFMAGGLLFALLFSFALTFAQRISRAEIAGFVDRMVGGEERFLSAVEVAHAGKEGVFHSLLLADASRLPIIPRNIIRWPRIGYRWGTGLALGVAFVLNAFPPEEPPPPVALWSLSSQSGPAPLEIECISHHQGVVEKVEWDFGDGEKESGVTAVHRYDRPGTYTLQLTVSGPGGVSQKEVNIDVLSSQNPWSQFEIHPKKGRAPLSITTRNRSRNGKEFQWNFGDGSISKKTNPLHEYSLPGSYKVTLTTINEWGSHASEETVLVIGAEAPLSDFRAFPRSGEAPLLVSFENLSTGEIEASEWDFGDLFSVGNESEAERNPEHLFRFPGTYTVTLISRGSGGEDVEKKKAYIQVGNSSGGGVGKGEAPHTPTKRGKTKSKKSGGEEGGLFGDRSKPNQIKIDPITVPSSSRENEKIDRDRWVWSGKERDITKKDGRDLKQLFPEYQRGVEKTMGKEKVPPVVRDYIKKYFEQIRPK